MPVPRRQPFEQPKERDQVRMVVGLKPIVRGTRGFANNLAKSAVGHFVSRRLPDEIAEVTQNFCCRNWVRLRG